MREYQKLASSASSMDAPEEHSSLYGRTQPPANKCGHLKNFVYLILSLAVIYALFLLFRHKSTPTPGEPDVPSNSSKVCRTKVCKDITRVMDLKADPCTDFYQFSCGNWSRKYPAPGNAQHWTNFVRLDRKNLEIIRKALEGKGKYKFNTKLFKKVRSFYEVCRSRDDESLADVRKLVNKLVNSTSINIGEKTPEKDLAKILTQLIKEFGISAFFKLSVGINDKDNNTD